MLLITINGERDKRSFKLLCWHRIMFISLWLTMSCDRSCDLSRLYSLVCWSYSLVYWIHGRWVSLCLCLRLLNTLNSWSSWRLDGSSASVCLLLGHTARKSSKCILSQLENAREVRSLWKISSGLCHAYSHWSKNVTPIFTARGSGSSIVFSVVETLLTW